ncbi:hypothetical protein AB7M49_004084 [Bradyrhizobium elkanii]
MHVRKVSREEHYMEKVDKHCTEPVSTSSMFEIGDVGNDEESRCWIS